jgi:predicted nucleotidyltransferase
MADPNIELLTGVADALGELRERLVFVGGCATALLITDPAAARVRATEDVDAIVAIVSPAEYHRLGGELRAKGFAQTLADGAPPYRWTYGGMKLDVMPIKEDVLGFSNRWYESAMRSATRIALREGLSIRLITAPCFVATKLDAFRDRGKGDYLASHDLEDVLSVVDGRPELVEEFRQADRELRKYVASVFAKLLADEGFLNAFPGLVIEGSPADRSPIVLERLRAIAQMSQD